MKVDSAGALPSEIRVRRTFDMIVHTGTVDIRPRGQSSVDDQSEDVKEEFVDMAPEEANAIIGVQVATDVVHYDVGGGGVMYVTFAGNPAILDER